MSSLYIVMPAYNEAMGIETTLEQWYPIVERVGPDSRLVVIDDGSKDGTFDILRRFAVDHPQLIAITKPNGGHGATVRFGYAFALERNADFIFQTDSDGQTEPGEFWHFWDLRERYDMVIGKRHDREDGLSRVIVTRVLRGVVHACFRTNIPDANAPFRLMSHESLAECLELVPEDHSLTNVVLAVIYFKKHKRIRFVPITFRDRRGGSNSIDLGDITRIGANALRDFVQLNRQIDRTL